MRVLHVIPAMSPKYGGPSHALIPMCRALIRRGIKVQIASTDAEPSGRMVIENQEGRYKGVPVVSFKKQWSEAFKYSRGLSRWLRQHVSGYDVVHIHGVFSHASYSAAKACRQTATPYIIRPLGNLETGSLAQKALKKRLFLRLGGNAMLRDAAAVHYVSQTEKELSERALRINHGVVIPLGINVTASDSFRAGSKPYDSRGPYVLVLSRLLPSKGIDVLLDAFLAARHHKGLGHWRLVLAGDGPVEFVSSLKKRIQADRAEDHVTLCGWLDGESKERALAQASLVALPSRRDSFGFCVVEAIAHGVPVLVSPDVGLASEIESAGAGWVSPVGAESLCTTLTDTLSNDRELRKRGDAGRTLAAKFDWSTVAEELIRLYDSVT